MAGSGRAPLPIDVDRVGTGNPGHDVALSGRPAPAAPSSIPPLARRVARARRHAFANSATVVAPGLAQHGGAAGNLSET
jgi:hypothetical protein